MPPETVLASTSAFESDGIVNSTDPLTELKSTDLPASSVNRASRRPLIVSSLARPARSCASRRPLMHEARTSPLTPVTSSEPLISLISSSLAVRGTVSVYSTPAGLLCEPQFQLWSCSGYLVRIERRSLAESISILASSSRSFVSAYFTASTFTSLRSQLEMCTAPLMLSSSTRPSAFRA